MEDNSPEGILQRVKRRMTLFFSEEIYTLDMLEEDLETGDVFYKPTEILPYLQTALMDEKILEVEFDGLTRVYFSRVHEHYPEPEEQKDNQTMNEVVKTKKKEEKKKSAEDVVLRYECRQFPRASGYPEDPATGIAAAALAVVMLAGAVAAHRARQGSHHLVLHDPRQTRVPLAEGTLVVEEGGRPADRGVHEQEAESCVLEPSTRLERVELAGKQQRGNGHRGRLGYK